MKFKSIVSNKNLKNKAVLLYVDFDFDIVGKNILNDRKIREVLESLEYLIYSGAKIVLFSKNNELRKIEFILSRLNSLLKLNKNFNNKIILYSDNSLDNLKSVVKIINPGDIICIKEFHSYIHSGIKKIEFMKNFSKIFNYFVFENFGDLFTENEEIIFLTKKINTYFGISFIEKYDEFLKINFNNNVSVIAGQYSMEKIIFMISLLKKGATILLGGEISSVFVDVYLYRLNNKKSVKGSNNIIINLLKKYKKRIILPVDFIMSKTRYKDINFYRKELKDLNKYEYIFDIGPETIKKYSQYISKARNLIWSGLIGYVEDKKFSHGSIMMAEMFCNKSKGPSHGVVIGTRTSEFVKNCKYGDDVDFMFYNKNTIYDLICEKNININI